MTDLFPQLLGTLVTLLTILAYNKNEKTEDKNKAPLLESIIISLFGWAGFISFVSIVVLTYYFKKQNDNKDLNNIKKLYKKFKVKITELNEFWDK